MRKSTAIAFGLILVTLAALAAGSRFLLTETQRSQILPRDVARQTTTAPRMSAPAAGDDRRLSREERNARRTQNQAPTETATWQYFEMVINLLNVLVGILGIWLTLQGMRMQRAAAASAVIPPPKS